MAITAPLPVRSLPHPRVGSAVLTGGCDGYAAGTTGTVQGFRQGCAVFVPDHPERVARWARRRTSVLVPPGLLAVYR
jgi:hypothetical protein